MPRLDRLKLVREGRNKGQKDIATLLEKSQTYVSRIESGEIEVSDQIVEQISKLLGVAKEELYTPSDEISAKTQGLVWGLITTFELGVREYGSIIEHRTAKGADLAGARLQNKDAQFRDTDIPGAGRLEAVLIDLLNSPVTDRRSRNKSKDARQLIAFCGTHGGLLASCKDAQASPSLLNALDGFVLQQNGSVRHIVRKPQQSACIDCVSSLTSALFLSMRYHIINHLEVIAPQTQIDRGELYDPLPIQYNYMQLEGGDGRDYPVDFYNFNDSGAIVAFPEYGNKTVSGGVQINARSAELNSYLDMIDAFGRSPLEIYGPLLRDSRRFQRRLSQTIHQRHILRQGFFGAATRPLLHFREGTEWWKRNVPRYGSISAIAESRKDRHHRFMKSLNDQLPYKQICSESEIVRWAATGRRSDLDDVSPYECDVERLDRLDFILDLLENYRNYELMILKPEKWTKQPSPNVSWAVSGDSEVDLERNTPNDGAWVRAVSGSQAVQGDRKVRSTIVEDSAARAFRAEFDQQWRDHQTGRDERKNAIDLLIKLRGDIQRSSSRRR